MSPASRQGLIDAIRVLRIELRIATDRIAAQVGLNSRDLDVLDVIDREYPCTPSQLADRTGIHRPTLTGILARLEDAGWITRSADPHDGRSCTLSPTDRLEEIRAHYATGDSWVRALAENLAEPDCRTVENFLVRTAQAVRDAAANIPPNE